MVMLLALVVGLLALLLLLVLGVLGVLVNALQQYLSLIEPASPLEPGDTVWISSLGQMRECVVTAVDTEGTIIVHPVGTSQSQ